MIGKLQALHDRHLVQKQKFGNGDILILVEMKVRMQRPCYRTLFKTFKVSLVDVEGSGLTHFQGY